MNIDDKLKLLNLTKNSTLDEIKIAYRKSVLKCHPDKLNGSTEEFIKLKSAYDDVVKWKTANINFYIIFSRFLTLYKEMLIVAKDIHIHVVVQIEDIYNKKTKKIQYVRETCQGKRSNTLYLELIDWKEKYVLEQHGDYDFITNKYTNLIIEIQVSFENYPFISINTILNLYELYIIIDISLFEYYFGVNRVVKYFDKDLTLTFNPYDEKCESEIKKHYGLENEGCLYDLIVMYKVDLLNVVKIYEHYDDIKQIFHDNTLHHNGVKTT